MYSASREPRPEWMEACRNVAPPSEYASHLTIRWVPGTPDAPIQRWVIFECVPQSAAEHLPALAQLDPESADPMLRWAWEYWTTHRALPIATWVVQGAGGGHPVAWTANENVLAKAGLLQPQDLPLMGDLPYAEPDQRAFHALQARRAILEKITDQHEARVVARQMAAQRARAAEVAQSHDALVEPMHEASRAVLETATVVDREAARTSVGLVMPDDIARYIETGDMTLIR